MATSIYMTHENGFRYHRYPDSPRRAHRVYWQRRATDGVRYLHRDVWEAANGPVPEGMHIHHINHDPLDNRPENLMAINGRDHLSHHMSNLPPERLEQMRHNMKLAADAARVSEWHKSPEGQAHHRRMARLSRESLKELTKSCAHCHQNFNTVSAKAIYCSGACKTGARVAARKDWVEVPCIRCGVARSVNKYMKRDHCRACGVLVKSERRLVRLSTTSP